VRVMLFWAFIRASNVIALFEYVMQEIVHEMGCP